MRYDLLPDFQDVPLLDRFRPHFDCPIYIEENIRALTLAELLAGDRPGTPPLPLPGGPLGVRHGHRDRRPDLYREPCAGRQGRPDGLPARRPGPDDDGAGLRQGDRPPGDRGAEVRPQDAGRTALLEKADDLSLADLVAGRRRGDRLIHGLLEQVGQDLGLVTANLANLFAPEKIILAGEVPSCCPLVRETLEEWFRRHTTPEILQDIVLADGSLSGFAAAMGAAYLGFLKTFPEEEVAPAENGRSPVLAAGR